MHIIILAPLPLIALQLENPTLRLHAPDIDPVQPEAILLGVPVRDRHADPLLLRVPQGRHVREQDELLVLERVVEAVQRSFRHAVREVGDRFAQVVEGGADAVLAVGLVQGEEAVEEVGGVREEREAGDFEARRWST